MHFRYWFYIALYLAMTSIMYNEHPNLNIFGVLAIQGIICLFICSIIELVIECGK